MSKRWFRKGKRLTSVPDEADYSAEEENESKTSLSSIEEDEEAEKEQSNTPFAIGESSAENSTLLYTPESTKTSFQHPSSKRDHRKKAFQVPITIKTVMDSSQTENKLNGLKEDEYYLFPRGDDGDKIDSIQQVAESKHSPNVERHVNPIGTGSESEGLVAVFEKMMADQRQKQTQPIDHRPHLSTRIADLPCFGDKKLTIKQFFNKYERYALLNEWTELQKALILPNCLVKRALTFYNTIPLEIQKDYKQCKERITNQFCSPEDIAKHRAILYTQRQGSEDLESFLERLELSFEELGTPDTTKIDILTANLRPELAYRLQMKQPKTYNDAVRFIQLKNALERPNQQDGELKDMVRQLLMNNGRSISHSKVMDNNDFDPVAMTRQIEQLKKITKNVKSSLNSITKDRSNGKTCTFCKRNGHVEAECRTKRYRNITCHTCGKNGHISKFCRSKNQHQEDTTK
uniref:CCHC-type domain-containing protein n=1 Tax=Clytia hemisphaerica TaxID=252671 RepID=A0A7M5TUQ9_9CNID